MHDEDIRRRALAPAQEDEIMERSVLTEVLLVRPSQLTILEIAMRTEALREEGGQDAVERAVRELSRDGLVSCDCRRIAPSRAAVRFEELIGGLG
jgi:hypothetical protein